MRTNDIKNKDEIRALMQKAITENDQDGFYQAFDKMIETIGNEVMQHYESQLEEFKNELDSSVLSARGVRQLTTEEKKYYQKLAEAMKDNNPKQALANANLVLPITVINSVFADLQENHPLLSKINFMPSGGAVEILMNTNGYQEALWGKLCDEIVQELASGFKVVDTMLLKLSAFIPVCKAMLDLGPEWLDTYVRQVLSEALANGLEAGIVAGDGNEKPIGMTRQVGDGVTVTGGVYPEKAKIKVSDLSATTIGNLLSLIAVDPNGKSRKVTDVIFVVSPADYFGKVMPATTIMAPDGTYRNDVMPYPMTIIQSHAVNPGEAVIGLAGRYLGVAGTATQGRIEYSDHYRFIEDERLYLIKLYANGMPMDNNAFLFLDITDLEPAVWKVQQVTARTASSEASLAELKIGGLTLEPAFDPATTTYAVETENATNTITAVPADASAEVDITVNGEVTANGTAFKWESGDNTVTVNVTAEDGSTAKEYTVTVTKA